MIEYRTFHIQGGPNRFPKLYSGAQINGVSPGAYSLFEPTSP
jgi:hypothetical protein